MQNDSSPSKLLEIEDRGEGRRVPVAGRFRKQVESVVSDANVIRIMCPNLACQRILAVPAHARGKLVRCRSCQITIRIPDPKARQAPASAPAPSEEAEGLSA